MILLHLFYGETFQTMLSLNFDFRWLTAEIIRNTVGMRNFSEYFTSVDKWALSKTMTMHSFHHLASPSPSLVKAKVNGCPVLWMALAVNFLGWLADTMFSKMICPGTFALSPGLPFPLFLSSLL